MPLQDRLQNKLWTSISVPLWSQQEGLQVTLGNSIVGRLWAKQEDVSDIFGT